MPIRRSWLAAAPKVRLALLFAFLCAMLAAACSSSGDTTTGANLLFAADDGTVLHGRVYGSGPTGVVLVHDFGSDQTVWQPLARNLADRGFLVLTYDMRGHGSSPGVKEPGVADADAAAAMRYMRSSLSRAQLLLVGGGLGAIAVLKVASREKVLGVASISAPAAYRGVTALNDVPRIVSPKLFIAAEGDMDAKDAARAFQEKAKEAEVALFPGSAKGVALLGTGAGSGAKDKLLQFLDANKPK